MNLTPPFVPNSRPLAPAREPRPASRRRPRKSSALLGIGGALSVLAAGNALGQEPRPAANGRAAEPSAARTYVITGASSGFGRGVALRLAARGSNVVLAARRTKLLNEVAREARAAGGTALVVTTDVSRPGDVKRLAGAALSRFGRIDVWINNAGVVGIGRFWDIPVEDQARIIDTNLKGVIYGSHAAMRQFRAQGAGTLVNVGSVESRVPLAYQAAYAASKAGVLSLGRTLNQEIRLSDTPAIKVSTVLPWAADTPVWTHAVNYSGRAPRMAAMDDPRKVVDAIVRMTDRPQEEISVGWKAQGATLSHRFFPGLTETVSANISHREQMQKAPPAAPTSGSLRRPMAAGSTVDGGVRQRMKAEDRRETTAASPGR